MDYLHIKNFNSGLWTNADTEDIPEDSFIELENLTPRYGKLSKTFGFGSKVGTALSTSIVNLVTYFHPELSVGVGTGSGIGYVYIAVVIDNTTKIVTLYYWTGTSWLSISSSLLKNALPTVYHRSDKNPIIQKNEILRIFPGNVGAADGSNESKGLWIGYINRDFFDEIYIADTDYDKGFWSYDTELDSPSISGLSMTKTQQSNGEYYDDEESVGPFESDDVRFYKFSYIYDGVNESLLTEDEIQHVFTEDSSFLRFNFSIVQASHNKRITAMKVYRSESPDSDYNFVHTINFLRKSGEYESGSDLVSGLRACCVPSLTTYNFNGGYSYRFKINLLGSDEYFSIDSSPSGTGNTYFTFTSDLNYNRWNQSWALQENSGGGYGDVESADTGFYGGRIAVLSSTLDVGSAGYIGGVIYVEDLEDEYFTVVDAKDCAIKINQLITSHFTGKNFYLLKRSNGVYKATENGANVDYVFFDSGLTEQETFTLLNSPSIKINGEFAIEFLGRLWQWGNIVLDPSGDDEETHNDWLAYSELNQYDVNPVGNVKKIASSYGGEGTGIALSYGSLILFKKSIIFKVSIDDINDIDTWRIKDLPFGRGNVAKKGVVQAGNTVYFCAWDGIYTLDPNIEAAADATPLIYNRISESIKDVYLALTDTQKAAIIGEYDQKNTEVIYDLNGTTYAWNIIDNKWRVINTSVTLSLMAKDEDGYVLIYDNSDKKLYGNSDESVGCKVRTKWIRIASNDSLMPFPYLRIRYKSATALTYNIYTDDSETAIETGALALSLSETEILIAPLTWCYKFSIKIEDTANGTGVTEIYEIRAGTD